MVTQAGTYVKELVHGEFGRTSPSIASIIGKNMEIDIAFLDVMNIELDFPKSLNRLTAWRLTNHFLEMKMSWNKAIIFIKQNQFWSFEKLKFTQHIYSFSSTSDFHFSPFFFPSTKSYLKSKAFAQLKTFNHIIIWTVNANFASWLYRSH